MNPHEYHALAMRTKSHDQTPVQRLTNAALGLAGEWAEFYELWYTNDNAPVETLKEAGDLLWYSAQATDALGLNFADIQWQVVTGTTNATCIKAIGTIAEIAKKAMFHGHPLGDEQRDQVMDALAYIVRDVRNVLVVYRWTMEDAMQANIDKLRRRYPDGFSAEASINREDAVYDE
jgi:hypothetical protein